MLWRPSPDSGADPDNAPFAQSPGLDRASVLIAVVLPTFKRPDHVKRTLASLAAQTIAVPFAVVVVENHAAGMEGASAAADVLASASLQGMVIVEPQAGNCNAYNAGFRRALASFPALTHVAIIDDDEIAIPEWLERLHGAAGEGADVVGGPQVPVFEDAEGARRYAMHPVFRSAHGESGAAGLITSTGNCLISADALRTMAPDFLDERFNFLGGGDTDFFTRLSGKGFRFRWSQDAAVRESVPPRRTERSWITARSVRNGLISALIQRKQMPGLAGRAKIIAKSLALLAASPFRSAVLAARTGSLYAGSYHMMVAAGRILAEFGYTIEQYREPEKN
jgi:glycosyltransferase involved in cell wall biosynthesis